MDFLVYEADGQKLEMLQNSYSIQWMPRYSESGTAEISCRLTDENLSLLKIGRLIVNTERSEVLFIDGIDIDTEAQSIAVSGYLDPLDKRINTSTAVLNYVSDLLEVVQNNLRGLSLEINRDFQDDVLIGRTESTWQNLREMFMEICEPNGVGYRVLFQKSGSVPVLEMYQGRQQATAVFSEDFGNTVIQQWTRSHRDSYNYAYVAGEGEDEDRTVAIVDRVQEGEERRELYVDARDIQKVFMDDDNNEIVIPDSEYIPLLEQRGQEYLDDYKKTDELTITINPNDELFKLGKDYDLGDIVKVESDYFGISRYFRISGLNIIYEKAKTIEVVLQEVIE